MTEKTTTDILLDKLISQITDLTASVNRLVIIDAVRVEKDKNQEKKNEIFDKFIMNSQPILIKSKSLHEIIQKAKVPIILFFVIGFLTMAGVNFSG